MRVGYRETMRNFISFQMQKNEMKLFHTQQQHSTLPYLQVPIFNGAPLEYKTFIHTFESLVETIHETERLHYLKQYTTVESKELVRSFHFCRGDMETNRELYLPMLRKALNWLEIKHNDATALHRYSIFLNSCVNAVQRNKYLDKFEHPDNIKRHVL